MAQGWLTQLVHYLVPAIQAVGVFIVVWGVLEAIVGIVRRTVQRADSATPNVIGDVRLRMGSRMVLALEFFIAGDIIQTVIVPTWESLGILSGIVVIRTLIAYFLEYELRAGGHRD
jgi:uncharacterized membrane protein